MSKDGKLCIGCGRSIDEITSWGYLSNQEKEEIIKKIYAQSILEKKSNKR